MKVGIKVEIKELAMAMDSVRVLNMSETKTLPIKTDMFFTTNTPLEKYCGFGDRIIIVWKGVRHRTLMRGSKLEIIATTITGQKPHLAILPDSSFFLAELPKNYADAGFEFNSPLTVRFLHDGKVFSFTTTLRRVNDEPRLLVMEYPEKVEFYNLRADKRVAAIFPANIAENGGAVKKLAAVRDISAGGARIGVDAVSGLGVGKTVYLSFTLPSGAPVSQLASVIRNIGEDGGNHFMGVGFLKHEPEVGEFCSECGDCDDVSADTLRDEDGVQCLLPAKVRRAENQAAPLVSSIIVDLGKGRLRLVTRTPLHIRLGDELSASFHPGGRFMDWQKIRMMGVSGRGSQFEYAAQFIDLDEKSAKLLDDYFTFCKAWTA